MLRLLAQDGDDLSIISAQMQDAIVTFSDMAFDAKRRNFVLVANRFAWDAAPAKIRRRTGLHFENVLGVQRLGFAHMSGESVLSLLAVTFVARDELAGTVTLLFSAGHSIRLNVECLDASMADMGPAWATTNQPDHAS
jgi:Protein of unknown function (DUF2948)